MLEIDIPVSYSGINKFSKYTQLQKYSTATYTVCSLTDNACDCKNTSTVYAVYCVFINCTGVENCTPRSSDNKDTPLMKNNLETPKILHV